MFTRKIFSFTVCNKIKPNLLYGKLETTIQNSKIMKQKRIWQNFDEEICLQIDGNEGILSETIQEEISSQNGELFERKRNSPICSPNISTEIRRRNYNGKFFSSQ